MKLPRLFSNGMVLQHGKPIPVWGWATPHQRVEVALAGRTSETQADAKGTWMVKLPKLSAAEHLGARLCLSVRADEELVIDDVLLGDVWLCAGGAELALPLASFPRTARSASSAAERSVPPIRFFSIAAVAAARPLDDVQADARWQPCTPAQAAAISAIACHSARGIHETLGIPVGIILASAPAERTASWISRAAIAGEHRLRGLLERAELDGATLSADSPAYRKLFKAWQEKARHADPGNAGVRRGWHRPILDDRSWPTIALPATWQAAGLDCAGAVWFRRSIAIPKPWSQRPLVLSLGAIADRATVYINGTALPAAAMPAAEPELPDITVRIPARLVVPGTMTIAVRVFSHSGPGGLVGPASAMSCAVEAHASAKGRPARPLAPIRLPGRWRYQLERRLEIKTSLPPPPLHAAHVDVPAGLNNGMIQPLIPYGLRGAIWHHRPDRGGTSEICQLLLETLIRDWRLAWGIGDFPVGVVHLPGEAVAGGEPSKRGAAPPHDPPWPATAPARVGIIPACDLPLAGAHGVADPREVGRRLAEWASLEATR
jgi:sialate O-acetylesterase